MQWFVCAAVVWEGRRDQAEWRQNKCGVVEIVVRKDVDGTAYGMNDDA